jgi:hypothetical protein
MATELRVKIIARLSQGGRKQMSVFEIAVFLAVLFLIYWMLKPLQHRIERRLYKYFRKKPSKHDDDTIDVTDSISRPSKNK